MPDSDFHFKVTNKPPSNEKPRNRILRTIISFLPFLSEKGESEKAEALAGRIYVQMRQDGSHLAAQVKDLKASLTKELKKAGEFQLLHLFESVVDPVLHEYTHIEKKINGTQPVHDRTLDTYNNWIEKAKMWTAITTKPFNRDLLVTALLHHIISNSDTLIRRDVKAIQEYAIHELHQLGLSELTLTAVASLVDKEASPHIDALVQLVENKPMALTVENVDEWKRLLNERRAKHYNNALHSIDEIVESLAPPEPEDPIDRSEMETL